MNPVTIRMYEELQLNQWPPLQTMLMDGWVLRFAEGYSKRSNSIHPLYRSGTDAEEKIAACERIYEEHGLRTAFKLSPAVYPADLDLLLEQRGYALIDRVSVQSMPLSVVKEPEPRSAVIDGAVTEEWLDSYCRLARASGEQRAIMRRMLANIRTKAAFVRLMHEGRAVACGIGVVERGYLGLWDVITDSEARNRGFGRQLLLHLLAWGKQNGAGQAFLAVVADNEPALSLYAKLGFKEMYRHWYRVQPGL